MITDQFLPDHSHDSLRYNHNTLGFFGQDDWTLGKQVTLEAGARADLEHVVYLLPRVALLYRPLHSLTIRLGGGLAYKLPTVFNATDDEDAYQQVYPIASGVRAERSASANLSFNYHGQVGDDIGFTIDQNFYYTRIMDALIPQRDSLLKGWLYYLNAPGPVFSTGSETNARFTLDDLSLYFGYTFTDARLQYLRGNPPLPPAPRSRLVSSVTYEAEPHWKVGTDFFYTGGQILDNGQTTPDFWTFDLMLSYTFRHCSLMVNAENLTDTRQSKFGPIFTGTMQNPVFNEVYAPNDGRIVSFAFRYSR